MPLSFEETKEIEELKQKNKVECFEWQKKLMNGEHSHKIERLEKLLEIAKAGGKIIETN